MTRGARRAALAVAVAVSLLATGGCTVTTSGTGRAAVTPRTSASAAASVTGQNPVSLLAAAREGLQHVFGYEAAGSILLGVQLVKVDLAVGPAGGHGTITAAGVTATLDYTGYAAAPGASGLYVTAPVAYWLRQGIDRADADRYADHQVSIPATSTLASGQVLVDQDGLTQLVFTAAGTVSAPEVLASPAVDGQAAAVVDFGGDHRTRMTVMTSGQQFPLRLVSPRATLSFGKFGVDPKVTTPSGTPLSLPS